jgi:hypothetical protein
MAAVHWDEERLEDGGGPLARGVQAEACPQKAKKYVSSQDPYSPVVSLKREAAVPQPIKAKGRGS